MSINGFVRSSQPTSISFSLIMRCFLAFLVVAQWNNGAIWLTGSTIGPRVLVTGKGWWCRVRFIEFLEITTHEYTVDMYWGPTGRVMQRDQPKFCFCLDLSSKHNMLFIVFVGVSNVPVRSLMGLPTREVCCNSDHLQWGIQEPTNVILWYINDISADSVGSIVHYATLLV